MKAMFFALGAAGLLATAAQSVTPTPYEFVEKAGASDKFEIDSAHQMTGSKNLAIRRFAVRMIADHGKSTHLVATAAAADGVKPVTPELTIGQRADVTALKAIPAGKSRDDLYIKQQKAAHDDALMLMQAYATDGGAPHLKATAAKILPVVATHRSMLKTM